MDEYNSGMDPEMKRLFGKIVKSFSLGALWLLTISTLGLFFGLGIINSSMHWYNILFYLILIVSLFMLLRYYYRAWR